MSGHVVMYSCTQEPSKDDERKLLLVLGYLQGTVEHKLLLRMMGTTCEVVAYVDAAYALHCDLK